MVQEASSKIDVCVPIPMLYGRGNHFWIRFDTYRDASILSTVEQMYESITLDEYGALLITYTDFSDGAKDKKGKPTLSPGILGFVSSCYQLGSIIGVPVAPWFNQKFGRRWAVMTGSLIMVLGAVIQGFAQNCKSMRSQRIRVWH